MNLEGVVVVGVVGGLAVWLVVEMVDGAAWLTGRVQRAWEDRDRRRLVSHMDRHRDEFSAVEDRLRQQAASLSRIIARRELLREEIDRAAIEADAWEWDQMARQLEAIRALPEVAR